VNITKTILLCTIIGLAPFTASATSLDELYRDIIRSDNSGYLPLFVKNRNEQIILIEEDDFDSAPQTQPTKIQTSSQRLKLSNDLLQKSALTKAKQIQWLKTLAAIKSNQVTPLELHDVMSRAQNNEPKAVEILAWMYTNGVGVSTDFVEAFNLYRKAAELKVANAEKNASIVYQSMNEEQRRKVKNKF